MSGLIKSEHEVAVELIKQLDGLSMETARGALAEAMGMLWSTQIVSATSPLLISESKHGDAGSKSHRTGKLVSLRIGHSADDD